MSDKKAIAASFGRAAAGYHAASPVQRRIAERLAGSITPDAAPLRVLDLGAGSGHLAAALGPRLPAARFTLADIAPTMLAEARGHLPDAALVAADAESLPFAEASFDLVASSLALQWCGDLPAIMRALARLLRPGGRLAVTTLLRGTFAEWRAAHEALGLAPALRFLPRAGDLARAMPWLASLDVETWLRPYARGRDFVADLHRQGAGVGNGRRLGPEELSRVIGRFEQAGAVASYEVATLRLNRPRVGGAFVTGTDTDVGKTVVAAILARAWGAEYWKPVQTGLAAAAGDSDFLRDQGVFTHPPRFSFAAPLSAAAAAAAENTAIGLADFALPETARPLVVEGAGGVAAPLDAEHDMADLATHLNLPAVLVARSSLGTINHTLLAIAELRRRGVLLLGVVLVGAQNAGNRAEIERRGNVGVLFECPMLPVLDRAAIDAAAANVPSLMKLGWTFFEARAWFMNN